METKANLLTTLGISENRYLELAFESGHEYLENRRRAFYEMFPTKVKRVDSFIRGLSVSPVFWRWWMQEWSRIDQRFIKLHNSKNLSVYMLLQNCANKVPPVNVMDELDAPSLIECENIDSIIRNIEEVV